MTKPTIDSNMVEFLLLAKVDGVWWDCQYMVAANPEEWCYISVSPSISVADNLDATSC